MKHDLLTTSCRFIVSLNNAGFGDRVRRVIKRFLRTTSHTKESVREYREYRESIPEVLLIHDELRSSGPSGYCFVDNLQRNSE